MLQQYRKQSWEPKNISRSDAGIHGDEKTGPPAEKRHTFKGEEEERSAIHTVQPFLRPVGFPHTDSRGARETAG